MQRRLDFSLVLKAVGSASEEQEFEFDAEQVWVRKWVTGFWMYWSFIEKIAGFALQDTVRVVDAWSDEGVDEGFSCREKEREVRPKDMMVSGSLYYLIPLPGAQCKNILIDVFCFALRSALCRSNHLQVVLASIPSAHFFIKDTSLLLCVCV